MPIQINFILNQMLDFKTYDGQKTIMLLDASRKLMGLKKKKNPQHTHTFILAFSIAVLLYIDTSHKST